MADSELLVERTLLTLRVLYGALLSGVVIFAVVAWRLVESRAGVQEFERRPALWIALAGLTVAVATAYPLVRKAQLTRLPRSHRGGEDATSELAGAFTTLWILGTAMIEAPTLFATVVFLVTGDRLALLAAAIGIVLIVARWPTEDGYRRFAAAATDPAG